MNDKQKIRKINSAKKSIEKAEAILGDIPEIFAWSEICLRKATMSIMETKDHLNRAIADIKNPNPGTEQS